MNPYFQISPMSVGRYRSACRLARLAPGAGILGSAGVTAGPQRVQVRHGQGARQQTELGSHISPIGRIPFFHERGPGISIDKTLQVGRGPGDR